MSDWPRDVIEFEKDMSQKDSVRTDTFTGKIEWQTLNKHKKVTLLKYNIYNTHIYLHRYIPDNSFNRMRS